VLAAFEEDLDRPVIEHFDLITGTSTGGIIALALGAGLTPREIIEFYSTHGPAIFPGGRWRGAKTALPIEI
jgi:patatin-like phospholipase/acyl hydrolase